MSLWEIIRKEDTLQRLIISSFQLNLIARKKGNNFLMKRLPLAYLFFFIRYYCCNVFTYSSIAVVVIATSEVSGLLALS